jgi:hypothetical protein
MEPQVTTPAGAPESPAGQAERRRRVRRSAILFAVIAAAFYFGFIALMLLRAAR